MKKMDSNNFWTPAFVGIYFIAGSAFVIGFTCWWNRFYDRRVREEKMWQRLQEWHAQERVAAAADNLPPAYPAIQPMPMPALQPAYVYDASDTTEELVDYCPACALQSVVAQGYRTADGDYPLPRGRRILCGAHTVEWEQRLDGDDGL